MSEADDYLQPYRSSLARHGAGFETTLWASRQSQAVRFEIFAEMTELAGKRLLDAGCGLGDFAEFLLEAGIAFDRYEGVDGLPEVIDAAAARRLPRCRFRAGDLLREPSLLRRGRPQVICVSGTLNTMTDAQVFALLESAWSATQETLLFNFLSDRCSRRAPPQDAIARRLDTLGMIDWAASRTTAWSVRHDYFRQGHDAAIAMHKAD